MLNEGYVLAIHSYVIGWPDLVVYWYSRGDAVPMPNLEANIFHLLANSVKNVSL